MFASSLVAILNEVVTSGKGLTAHLGTVTKIVKIVKGRAGQGRPYTPTFSKLVLPHRHPSARQNFSKKTAGAVTGISHTDYPVFVVLPSSSKHSQYVRQSTTQVIHLRTPPGPSAKKYGWKDLNSMGPSAS